MAYEMFERSGIRVDTPALSIAPQGSVAMNAAACRLLMDAGIKMVVILWDEAANRMAIKAAPKGERNSFTITFTGKHSASIRAKAFLRHIGWNSPERQALATTWSPTGKMFEATLPPQYLAASSTVGPGLKPKRRPAKGAPERP